MIGIVEVIFTNPVKLDSPSSGPIFEAPCANGPSVMLWLPSRDPALSYTVNVTVADCVGDGFAYATPVRVWANVANSVVGAVSPFTPASSSGTPLVYTRKSMLACTGPVQVAWAQPSNTDPI